MPRTLRSKKLRSLLWRYADGICQICGLDLDPEDWHADHIVPWSVTKRTNVHEMQALCPPCNQKKSDVQPEERKGKMQANYVDWDAFRKEQRDAIRTCLARFKSGEKSTAIVMPPRTGKSDTILTVGLELVEMDLASVGVVLVPFDTLRSQATSDQSRENYNKRYRPTYKRMDMVAGKKDSDWLFANNAMIYATIQGAQDKRKEGHNEKAESWVIDRLRRIKIRHNGLPPVVFIDECHYLSEKNNWGELVSKFHSLGCHVFLFTGTPYRTDGEVIPGFRYEDRDTEKDQVCVPYRNDEDELWVKVYERQTAIRRLLPDYEVTMSVCFERGYLSRLEFRPIDSSWVKFLEGKEIESSAFIDLPQARQRRLLRDFTEQDQTIRIGVEMFLESWSRYGRCQGLIYTNSDDDGNTDVHAARVEAELRRQSRGRGLELKTQIVTTNTGKTAESLSDFRAGKFDVLIAKQVGSVGLDVQALKVCLDLSTVSTVAAKVQAWLRVGNAGDPGTIIYIEDSCRLAIREGIQGSQELGKHRVTTQIREMGEVKVDPKENPKENWRFSGASRGSATDSDGMGAEPELHRQAIRLQSEIPELRRLTSSALAGILKKSKEELPTKTEDVSGLTNKQSETSKEKQKAVKSAHNAAYRAKEPGDQGPDERRFAAVFALFKDKKGYSFKSIKMEPEKAIAAREFFDQLIPVDVRRKVKEMDRASALGQDWPQPGI